MGKLIDLLININIFFILFELLKKNCYTIYVLKNCAPFMYKSKYYAPN